MTDYSALFRETVPSSLQPWFADLPAQLAEALDPSRHGDLTRWGELLNRLPAISPSRVDLNRDAVTIGGEGDCDHAVSDRIEAVLRELHPWRKGPFSIHGVSIDTEWRSDLKWNRLADHIQPLAGRLVLDVGCGNGYHCWRMLGAGARLVLGIDPTLVSVMQFHAVKHFAGPRPVYLLPLGIEDVPTGLRAFDTVFSMGVLHHRRSPLDHLLELRGLLRPGGELVLETLVIGGREGEVLLPEDRYARMRNVWFLPSPPTLLGWLKRCGFRNPRLIDVSLTTGEEQRRTGWMQFQSLADFLDPTDSSRTCEGLPAPRRGMFLAESP